MVQSTTKNTKNVLDVIILSHDCAQVRDNVEKAQERQKAAYRRKKKKGTKRFIVTPGMVVLKKNERKRGRPGMTMLPEWPTKYRYVLFLLITLKHILTYLT